MELKDFTEQEQEQIKQGLSTAEISDKEAGKKLLALVPARMDQTHSFLCQRACDDQDS